MAGIDKSEDENADGDADGEHDFADRLDGGDIHGCDRVIEGADVARCLGRPGAYRKRRLC